MLAGIFGVNYLQSIRRANLNEAATTVYTELNRARSLAQCTSVSQPVTWTAKKLNAGVDRSITVPNEAQIVSTSLRGVTRVGFRWQGLQLSENLQNGAYYAQNLSVNFPARSPRSLMHSSPEAREFLSW
ncbi:hypothetical protein [Deinococcus arenicola]|uniref:Pilus assembly protein n=1 Tax=Deinococcus arenicola TaxID=2994950 RepID=A0ABU4DW03_9DEIO|nr:hypothetical protein [Deinococcus sp. ZS9-10]MDV6376622.1 hypothetical protein [Deinococcus sp. ZS9-10]